jgi:hypothetical protein
MTFFRLKGLINKHRSKERTVHILYTVDDIPRFVVLDKIEIATLPNIQHSPPLHPRQIDEDSFSQAVIREGRYLIS